MLNNNKLKKYYEFQVNWKGFVTIESGQKESVMELDLIEKMNDLSYSFQMEVFTNLTVFRFKVVAYNGRLVTVSTAFCYYYYIHTTS